MRAIAVHMLPNGLCITRSDSNTVWNCEAESASRQAGGQPADRKRDNEDSPSGCAPHFVTTLQISHRKDLCELYQREALELKNAVCLQSPGAYIRKIITSVAFISAAAVCPDFSCISRADLAVMMDVIRWPPIEICTSAIKPLMRTDSILPTS